MYEHIKLVILLNHDLDLERVTKAMQFSISHIFGDGAGMGRWHMPAGRFESSLDGSARYR